MGKVFRLRGKLAEPDPEKINSKTPYCPRCGKSFSKYKLRKNNKGKVVSRHCPNCDYKFPKKKSATSK